MENQNPTKYDPIGVLIVMVSLAIMISTVYLFFHTWYESGRDMIQSYWKIKNMEANILLEESDKCYNICTEQNGTFIFYDYKQQPPSCICNFGNYTKDIYEVK